MNGEIRSIKKLSNSRKQNIPRENSEENVPSVKGETKIDFAERQKRLNKLDPCVRKSLLNMRKID